MPREQVATLIGDANAVNWREMSREQFSAMYTLNVVAGSIEKPTSVFKKKEAIQIAQAVGQFARAAPATGLQIILRMMENAFTEVNITEADWRTLREEAKAMMQKGNTSPSAGPGANIDPATVPPDVKQKIVEAKRQGASQEQLTAMLQEAMGQASA